jgi:DNA-directed RNA polymerase specialized sigma24 family protein
MSPAKPTPLSEPQNPESEVSLVQRWREGDQAAAAQLWTRHRRLALAVAERALGGTTDANQEGQEICHDVFLRCLVHFDVERAAPVEQPFRAYFFAALRNAAIDKRRRLERRTEAATDLPTISVEARLAAHQIAVRLRDFVKEHYLPSDWDLVAAWMRARASEEPVPWKDLAQAVLVTVPGTLQFQPESTDVPAEHPTLRLAARTLDLLPQVVLGLVTNAGPNEGGHIPRIRLSAARLIVQGLRSRGTMERGKERIQEQVSGATGVARMWVEVVEGAQRTADALRMRVEKVILLRFQQSLAEVSHG